MIPRRGLSIVETLLTEAPAVVLLGPRQCGKTTLALALAQRQNAAYFDLESERDRTRLSDVETTLGALQGRLVILDEVHRMPALFQPLRGLIDRGRAAGRRSGQFLLLGSASLDLMQQSGESLAGRIAIHELSPLDPTEVEADASAQLWLRGGFPDSFLAASDGASLRWRRNFIRTYLERDVAAFAPRIPAESLSRFWTMLAHRQGGLLNAADLARSLDVDGKTIARYLDLLVDLLLVRRLQPLHRNVGKRLTKSPKVIIRDSGLVHALLQIGTQDDLDGHPIVGASWESHVVETLIRAAPDGTTPYFYRTAAGAEIDLFLDIPGHGDWAIEIKRSAAPKLEKGFHNAIADLKPRHRRLVHGGSDSFPMGQDIEAIGLATLARTFAALG